MIKKAAVDAVQASKPVAFCFGKVISESPLQINVEQKITLGPAQLVLGQNVTDYQMKNGGHIYNHLEIGDEVILSQMQGGQKYIVLDRVGKL